MIKHQLLRHKSKIIAFLSFIFNFLLLSLPLLSQAFLQENRVMVSSNTNMLGFMISIYENALLFVIIAFLLYLISLPNVKKSLEISIKIVIFLLFLFNSANFYIQLEFNQNINSENVAKYGSYLVEYMTQTYPIIYILIAFLIVGYLFFLFVKKTYISCSKTGLYVAFSTILTTIFLCFSWTHNDTSRMDVVKMISKKKFTFSSNNYKDYSPEFIKNFSYQEETNCHHSDEQSPNIMILMIESFSQQQSKFFSGIHDWTPNIDKIAQNNLAFTNFYANGTETEKAQISMLTGRIPVKASSTFFHPFDGLFNVQDSLPKILKKHGYYTQYLTTADLNFSKTGEWVASLGFDYFEDSTNSFYDKYDKFSFKAAPDKALFSRVLDRIDSHKGKPLFTYIKTVSTHRPFTHPETKLESEEGVFRYSDREIGIFFDQLKKRNFFEDSILIIVGDHHKMEPPTQEEIKHFGPIRSQSKVPLIVVSKSTKPQIISEQFQQTDIYNSFKNLVSDQSCTSKWLGDIFERKYHPQYIAFKHESIYYPITIFEENKTYHIHLDADDSWVSDSGQLNATSKNDILNKIHSMRINTLK